MRKATLAVAVLVMALLIAPVAALGHADNGESVKVKIELPFTLGGPTSDCPASTFFTVDYRISSNGSTGSARNCILGFNAVDCAPSVCVEIPLLAMFRLPGGTITAQVTLSERAPCDPAGGANCTTVQHTWSGTVTEATGRFEELEGSTVSGGGVAVYRFPPDPVEPFASFKHYKVLIGERGEDE